MCQGTHDCGGECGNGTNANTNTITTTTTNNNFYNNYNNNKSISTRSSVIQPSRNSMTMGGVRGGSTLNEVGVARHVPHYASTPHLFVYQAAEEEDEVENDTKEIKEPIYSSAIDIRKVAANKEVRVSFPAERHCFNHFDS